MAQWLRHGNKPRILTLADRSVGGRLRAEKTRARKPEERAREEEDRKAPGGPDVSALDAAELVGIAQSRLVEPEPDEPPPPRRLQGVRDIENLLRTGAGPSSSEEGRSGPARGREAGAIEVVLEP